MSTTIEELLTPTKRMELYNLERIMVNAQKDKEFDEWLEVMKRAIENLTKKPEPITDSKIAKMKDDFETCEDPELKNFLGIQYQLYTNDHIDCPICKKQMQVINAKDIPDDATNSVANLYCGECGALLMQNATLGIDQEPTALGSVILKIKKKFGIQLSYIK